MTTASSTRPRVIYVLPHFDPDSSEHFAHVIPFLGELGSRIDVAVVVERATAPPAISNVSRVEVLPSGWPPAMRLFALAAAFLRLRRAGYRKAFVRISIPAGLVAGTVGRLVGIESYYWNSGQGKNTAPPAAPGLRAKWRRWRYELGLLPFYAVSRTVHHFVTGPAGMEQYYAREYGVNPEKVILFANDIDVERFRRTLDAAPKEAVRRELGLDARSPVVLFVGRVSPLKGGEHLLPIAERVLARCPEAIFLIVGPVHIRSFNDAWRTHPGRDRIRLLGAVPNADVARLYAAADVFMLPSNSEGFPRVLLECLAAGLAFVAFDVGGVRRIADPAHGRYIVSRGDVEAFAERLVELINDPGRRAALGAAGRMRATLFDTPRVADLFVERIAV